MKKIICICLAGALMSGLCACNNAVSVTSESVTEQTTMTEEQISQEETEEYTEQSAEVSEETDMLIDYEQMKAYADRFLMALDKRYLSVVENAEGEVIGMGVCITSLSRAVQKAKSKLFPFGWYYVAKALWFNKHPQVLDMLLVGVLPEYHDKGANALIFANVIPEATKDGYEWAETHPQLEDTLASQTQWKNLDCAIHKRRAAFGKDI